ncbi:MAG: N-acetyltransferase [Flavobacteriales bacterium]|nr:MAG: N-acetyltransferase [Flavobacteriales bacterium]
MDKPTLVLDKNGQGAFVIMDGDEQVAEMVLKVDEQQLIVYHTEVAQQAEGKGLAKEMLNAMVAYARENKLKVVPLCPYVHAQFKRHPADFADLWTASAD